MNRLCVQPNGRWLSYHVFIPAGSNVFLIRHLYPLVSAQLSANLIRRFFFIRYSEGGPHLRVRYLPEESVRAELLKTALVSAVERFTREAPEDDREIRVEESVYDRAEHYFGESLQSVYAELLNEQTSYVALRLLAMPLGDRQTAVCAAGCLLWWCAEKAAANSRDYLRTLSDSEAFALDSVAHFNLPMTPLPQNEKVALERNLRRLRPHLENYCNADPSLARIRRLLRRARAMPLHGGFVATHALHLLSNKLGVTLQEEGYLFATLRSIGAAP